MARRLAAAERELRAAQERADRAARAQRQLLTLLSHDLRNPLSVIMVSNRLLARGLAPNAPTRRQVDAIGRAADEMNQLIADLNDAAAMESGDFCVADRSVYDLASVVQDAVDLARPAAASKPVELSVDAGALPAVLGDRDRLAHALTHLVLQAIKFTPKNGHVRVSAFTDTAGDGRVCVADDGPGVSSEQLALAFGYPLREQRPMSQGQGVGPYVAKGIVEAHGGRIWIESSQGAGTRVYFTLPPAPKGGELATDASQRRTIE